VEWCARAERLVEAFLSERGTVLAASCEEGSWFVRVLYPTRTCLSRVANRCQAADFQFDIKRIYGLDGGREERFDLTDKQQTALEAALKSGYYGIPRETNAAQLATELDVSHQALSERLRRAHKSLVENALTTGHLSE
jgi:predicted DNA binding protein